MDDHERRIARYRLRAAAGLPLFDTADDTPHPLTAGATEWRCVGCDALCRFSRQFALPSGWERVTSMWRGVTIRELHCPECVRQWGYGSMHEATNQVA